MKIFIGGLLPVRQDRFKQLYPDVEFLFASDQERPQRWLSRAKKADVVIIDQARCSHKVVNLLKANDVQYQFADGNLSIALLIQRIQNELVPEEGS